MNWDTFLSDTIGFFCLYFKISADQLIGMNHIVGIGLFIILIKFSFSYFILRPANYIRGK